MSRVNPERRKVYRDYVDHLGRVVRLADGDPRIQSMRHPDGINSAVDPDYPKQEPLA